MKKSHLKNLLLRLALMLGLLVGLSSSVWAITFNSGDVLYVDATDCEWYENDNCGASIYFYGGSTLGPMHMNKVETKIYSYTFTSQVTITHFKVFRQPLDQSGWNSEYNGVESDFSGKGTNNCIKINSSSSGFSWSSYQGGGKLNEPYIISVYKTGEAGTHFTFTPIAGSTNYEYEVSVEIPNYTGNPSDYNYWVGENNAWSNTYSEDKNLGDVLTDCSTGAFGAKIYALNESGQPHGSDYKNYGIHDFVCKASSAKLVLSSDVREFDKAEPPVRITLTAQADDKTEGNYMWYKSDDAGSTYTLMGESIENTYTLDEIPTAARNYYKVERKKVDSNDYVAAIVVIYTVQSCDENSKGSNIFRETFGELSAVRGSGSRTSFDGIVDGYSYQPAPYKINDGYYAVVADPYYCGCGDGSNMEEVVGDNCLANNAWFRQLRDNTLNNSSNLSPFGGMLLLNFKEKGIAYQRELTEEEQKNITKNSILKFSAYFASAAKEDPNFIGIDMELSIQFQKTNTSDWINASTITSQVNFEDGWQRADVEWKVEDTDGKFRVVINNKSDSGSGNDLLVDDISLDLCTPAFALYFVDEDDKQFEDKVVENVEESSKIQIKKINFGSLGDDPCIQLYQVVDKESNISYKYISDFTESGDYYVTNVTASEVFSAIPENIQFVAVASSKENGVCNSEIQAKIEAGEYTPGGQTNAIFSGNHLTYHVQCGTSLLTNPSDETKVCVSNSSSVATPIPVLKLSSVQATNVVTCNIFVNGVSFIEGINYQEETDGCGYMLLDLNKLYSDLNNGAIYQWPVGEQKISVTVSETYMDVSRCEREADGFVSVKVVERPSISIPIEGAEVCEGESATISVAASPVTKYQWQILQPGDSDWSNIGSGKDTLQTSLGMANETQYRVLLYNDNDLLCATTSDVATMTVVHCDNLVLTQSIDNPSVCVGDKVTYTVKLKNHAAGKALNVAVDLVWNNAELLFESASLPQAFDATTKTWNVGEMDSKEEISLDLTFTVLVSSENALLVKSFVSSLNNGTYGEYDRQLDDKMKGTSEVVLNGKAPNPVPKRKQLENEDDEYFSYNQCPIAKIVKFDELIKGDGFDMTLVWVDAEGNLIENPSFDANVPIEDGVAYVYNAPEGLCQSDIIEVHYRVKKVTPTPEVTPYEACALTGTAEEVQLSLMDRIKHPDGETYKYVAFYDENDVEVTSKTFDASKPGTTTYTVKVSMDEINSQSNNYCEAQATFTVTVKDYAVSAEIIANGTSVCPNTSATLTASSSVSGAVYHWHQLQQDGSYTMVYTGATYTTPVLTKSESYKVTVTGANLCEQSVDEGKVVEVTMLTKITSIELTPATSDFVIGGNDVKTLTITPSNAVYNTIWTANGKQIEVETNGNVQNTIERPYVDTEYQVEVIGECSRDTVYATTTVVWPTVFTPYQQDGLNDTFVKDMNPNFHTAIFNRFGMPLVETKNGWDGKLADGKLAVPGVYYYVVTLPDGNVQKGTIEVFKK